MQTCECVTLIKLGNTFRFNALVWASHLVAQISTERFMQKIAGLTYGDLQKILNIDRLAQRHLAHSNYG